jgi:hypothetical protein
MKYCVYCDREHEGKCPAVEVSVGMSAVLAAQDKYNRSVFEREIWNAAIEAAAVRLESSPEMKPAAIDVRGLKK